MNKGISLILFLLISGISLAQGGTAETTENVTSPAPFDGTVTYSIFWKGPNTALWAEQLPDSMALTACKGDLRVQVFGGISDQLIQEYLWFHGTGQFFLVDHKNKVLYTDPQGAEPVKLRKQSLSSEAKEILGHACDAYRFSGNGNADTYWLSPQLALPIGDVPDSVFSPPFIDPDLKMIPLRMERNVNGVKSTTVATNIAPGVDPILLPGDYEQKPFFKHVARHPYLPKGEE